jgi:hypothetical protein
MIMCSPPKRKVGRPRNSFTTVKVKLLDLLGVLHPNSPVIIGRKFAEGIGLDLPELAPEPQQLDMKKLRQGSGETDDVKQEGNTLLVLDSL